MRIGRLSAAAATVLVAAWAVVGFARVYDDGCSRRPSRNPAC